MTEAEKITTEIGEFASMEMNCVERIEYSKNKKLTSFIIFLKNGNEYILNIEKRQTSCS